MVFKVPPVVLKMTQNCVKPAEVEGREVVKNEVVLLCYGVYPTLILSIYIYYILSLIYSMLILKLFSGFSVHFITITTLSPRLFKKFKD